MIRILAAAFAILAFAAPAAAIDRVYPVADFDRLVVEGPYRVQLAVGRATTVRANGTAAGLDRLSIEGTGQTLRIRRNRNAWGAAAIGDAGPVTITLTTRTLRSARLVGPATVEVSGARGLAVEFVVEGSGTLKATGLAADTLTLGLVGAGGLELAGTARIVRGQFQGTGSVAAAGLAAGEATIVTNTIGNVVLNVSGPATITATGLGEVVVGGRPICTLRGPGAAVVRCGPSEQRQAR